MLCAFNTTITQQFGELQESDEEFNRNKWNGTAAKYRNFTPLLL